MPTFLFVPERILARRHADGWAGADPRLHSERYVFHLRLAILATGTGILSALSLTIGLILHAISRYHNENFELCGGSGGSPSAFGLRMITARAVN
jgi:hypothetical protein